MFCELSSASGSTVIAFICKVLHCSADLIFGATAAQWAKIASKGKYLFLM